MYVPLLSECGNALWSIGTYFFGNQKAAPTQAVSNTEGTAGVGGDKGSLSSLRNMTGNSCVDGLLGGVWDGGAWLIGGCRYGIGYIFSLGGNIFRNSRVIEFFMGKVEVNPAENGEGE